MIRTIQPLWMACLFLWTLPAHAEIPAFSSGQPYEEVKAALIKQGWQAVSNPDISGSSLYAQEVYQQGKPEVVDCVSMELDGCWFLYKKGRQTLQVRTITRALRFESVQHSK
ncbi:hypothetical protein ED236_02775 [Pseudomethylobacillus aquaticus]|uniref:Uncharacterized protein n=1 Tax=Pseudomethylobacillus aquaticus TaxID=2676064 RepID=A0A3N0V6H5_9PROT|nr:hypothetical protein [Pseudomethylobacillus aquaticus]ROH88396.1 hypothetical protein ED236_02775 [Pseudomethylobacillus aquaticus]